MLELNIKAKLLDKAGQEMIGIKDAIAYVVEKWLVSIEFSIDDSEPLQLSLTDKPKIRQTVTVAAAKQALQSKNLTIEEYQNIIEAIIDLTKIAEGEANGE